jgi:hypothetical protein
MKTILILVVVLAFHLGLALASALGPRIVASQEARANASAVSTPAVTGIRAAELPRGAEGPTAQAAERPGGGR